MQHYSMTAAELDALVALFYPDPSLLGEFQWIHQDALPPLSRKLLAHDQHMTVTVESFHRDEVDVEALAINNADSSQYRRKIVLRRRRDRQPVLFGIVRMDLTVMEPSVADEIRQLGKPLGSILIAHNVLRSVELVALWEVVAGNDLAEILNVAAGTVLFGRTARIYCNGEPAIELLEIVTSDDSPKTN
ncbi:MAG: hypothetical protein R3E01_28835 [Pirellulaceae bacterium]|nr:hypothetical protein [Planctomycetales bacterium]